MPGESLWTELARQLAAAGTIEDRYVARYLKELASLRVDLLSLAQGSRWRPADLGKLRDEIDRTMRAAAERMGRTGLDGSQEAWLAGERAIDALARAGKLQVNLVPGFATTNLTRQAFAAFTFDRIRAVTEEMRSAIQGVVVSAVLGGASVFDAMTDITHIVGLRDLAGFREIGTTGVSAKGERILRTEIMGNLNAAGQARLEELGQTVPGLKKVWMATGDDRTRDSHLAAHGQVRKVDEPFVIGDGEKAMQPGDPALSAKERINCRCRSVPYSEEWGSVDEVLGAMTDQVNAEKQRRGQPVTTPERASFASVRAALEARGADYEQLEAKLRGSLARRVQRLDKTTEALLAFGKPLDELTSRIVWWQGKPGGEAMIAELTRQQEAMMAKLKLAEAAWERARASSIGAAVSRAIGLPADQRMGMAMRLWSGGPGGARLATEAVAGVRRTAREAIEFGRSLAWAGQYPQPSMEVSVAYFDTLERAFHSEFIQAGSMGTINMFRQDVTAQYVHEVGHALERSSPHIQQRAIEFLDYRRGMGEKEQPLGTGPGETAWFDRWQNPYTGKLYRNAQGGITTTELLSTGLQQIYEDPLGMLERDPEFFRFIVGVLRGWL